MDAASTRRIENASPAANMPDFYSIERELADETFLDVSRFLFAGQSNMIGHSSPNTVERNCQGVEFKWHKGGADQGTKDIPQYSQ
jgi:hypothetical protein